MAELLAGIILTFVLGISVGNYATSFVHRMPRRENLFAIIGDEFTIRKPFCSSCEVPLKVRDLFPVLSWFLNKGKCRSCGATIPKNYLYVELASGLLFVLAYVQFNFSQDFILVATWGMVAITLIATYALHAVIFPIYFILLAAVGTVYRTFYDGSIYGTLGGGILGLALGLLLWRIERFCGIRHEGTPIYVALFAVGGSTLGPEKLILLMFVLLVLRAITSRLPQQRQQNILLTVWAGCVLLGMFYPFY